MIPFRHKVETGALILLGGLLRWLPRKAGISLGEILGGLVYRIGIRTAVATGNVSTAFPDLSQEEIHCLVHRCYRHFGALLAEFCRLPLLRPENVNDLVDFEGIEILDQALSQGRGGIVVSGHLGNWELMGSSIAVMGYPVSYVVTGQENEDVERMMNRLRQGTGVSIIKRREALKGVLKALKDNNLVAILSDQDAHEAGAFVPFFGQLASTPRGAAVFSLRSGVPLIFASSFRQGKGRLKVVIQGVSQQNLPDEHERAIWELTCRYTALLEEAVRRHPEQWFWMHRRWKTPPPK